MAAGARRPIGEAGWGWTLGAGIVSFIYFFPVLWIILTAFKQNQDAALKKHGGTTQMLEGKRGTRIDLSGGGVAIHIPDGYTARALVLMFSDPQQVEGIEENAQFRFRCTVANFDYQYLNMDNCTVVRE